MPHAPRLRLIAAIVAVGAAALISSPVEGRQSGELIVETTDSLGHPWAAEYVHWYRVVGEVTVEDHEGTCMNAECSRWSFDVQPTGSFHIEAWWTAEMPQDPACDWHAYDAKPATRGPGGTTVVRMKLHALLTCE